MKQVISILSSLLMAVIMGLAFSFALGIAPALGVLGFTVLGTLMSFVPMPSGVSFMAIQKEIWQNYIAENIFKNNDFITAAVNDDQYVLAGKVVHIPQAGAAPSVSKNRDVLPAVIVQRTDTDVTYSLDEYTSDPVFIPNAETVELSYDKIANVLGDIMGSLKDAVADYLLFSWAPVTRIIRTTGGGGATTVAAHLPSATGNRKKMSLADLKAAQLYMDKLNIPTVDRYSIFSADMLNQLTDELTASQYRDFVNGYDGANGIVGKLFGFQIYKRGSVLVYDNTATPVVKAVGAAGAATDNDCVLCWQKQALSRAMGEIKWFEKIGDPTYYGDIYSGLVRLGGRIRRSDEKGVLAIVQVP